MCDTRPVEQRYPRLSSIVFAVAFTLSGAIAGGLFVLAWMEV